MHTSAPAKIILFGEHAVVYGQPALAVPVSSLRAEASITPDAGGLKIRALDLNEVLPVDVAAELVDNALVMTARRVLEVLACPPPDALINLHSTIPMASGLGSGAAVSTALARAVAMAAGHALNAETTNQIIFDIEKLHHGTPSGIDNTVIVYEQPVFFVRGQPLETLKIARPFHIVIADTGQSALTRVAVGDVRKLYESDPAGIQPILDEIGQIARQAKQAIETGDINALGPLMNRNHELLQRLTVSSPELDQLVMAARAAGALGAKLSGGGRGGNMIALAPSSETATIEKALKDAGAARVFTSTVGD